ncbi:Mob1/phocein [Bimuria novae-zelandiae CBS 107.79]|uniref:Mob1/phocein n=1 Tax=Bimuria novae-zelandiae CBS 107.79 TaxID=1447943 RepID=A0A6A5VTQ7_9PLEO|nr:Mob1/phocein [Bimuria novae-zelandiae CBS 107.79]
MPSAPSPSSSPRLPSPPPIAEDQLSPLPATEEQQKLFSSLDNGASRRIRPGTKAEDMAEGPPLVELSEVDSAFQLTEHLKALHNFYTHPIGSDSVTPVDREIAQKLATPPDNVDKTLWLYELCRLFTQKANAIVIALFSDNPPCSSTTCPEMRASEWQYLCAVHDPPKSCCAIDYCCHTLDWAANTLTSPKNFPSRLAMGTDQTTQDKQMRNLTNIFRRVYRIFAHAWFQHRDMFWKVEGRTGLYTLFKTVCDAYGLIPEDNYTIPPEAEGLDDTEETSAAPPKILRREPSGAGSSDIGNTSVIEAGDHTLSTAGTTKRHRHSPSVSATLVSTVLEESEEEDSEAKEDPAQQVESDIPAIESISLQPPAEDTAEPQEEDQLADGETDSTDETTANEPHATEDPEKQNSSEADHEPQTNEETAESEATAGDEDAPAALVASEEETAEDIQADVHATPEETEPEKEEKEAAAGEADKPALTE